MARITLLDVHSAQGDAKRALSSKVGHLGVFRTLAHASTNIVPIMRLGQSILGEQKLGARERELLILLAMKLEGGVYEWNQHVEIALGVGATQEEVDTIAQLKIRDTIFSQKDRALFAFGQTVVTQVRVSDAIFTDVRAHFSEQEIVETILVVSFYMMLARVTEALEVELDPVQGMGVLRSSTSRPLDSHKK